MPGVGRISAVAVLAILFLVFSFALALAQPDFDEPPPPALPGPAQPGDHGFHHEDFHHLYSQLKQPDTGYGCCSDADCRPTTATQDAQGRWWAIVDRQRVFVPENKVIRNQTMPDGHAHICASPYDPNTIYCFVPPAPMY